MTLPYRIGHGYDLHRLEYSGEAVNPKPFILGGVGIEFNRSPVAHSDGDTLLHAITDALLGAIGAPDIGQLFPDDDPRHASKDSRVFLVEAARRVREAGYTIGNLDATVICEAPKISPYKDLMRTNIAAGLDIAEDQINIKGKTHEGVDAIGQGDAIEVHCVVMLIAREG